MELYALIRIAFLCFGNINHGTQLKLAQITALAYLVHFSIRFAVITSSIMKSLLQSLQDQVMIVNCYAIAQIFLEQGSASFTMRCGSLPVVDDFKCQKILQLPSDLNTNSTYILEKYRSEVVTYTMLSGVFGEWGKKMMVLQNGMIVAKKVKKFSSLFGNQNRHGLTFKKLIFKKDLHLFKILRSFQNRLFLNAAMPVPRGVFKL